MCFDSRLMLHVDINVARSLGRRANSFRRLLSIGHNDCFSSTTVEWDLESQQGKYFKSTRCIAYIFSITISERLFIFDIDIVITNSFDVYTRL